VDDWLLSATLPADSREREQLGGLMRRQPAASKGQGPGAQ